jgi:hypothetical protein
MEMVIFPQVISSSPSINVGVCDEWCLEFWRIHSMPYSEETYKVENKLQDN